METFQFFVPFSQRQTVIATGDFVCNIEASNKTEALEIFRAHFSGGIVNKPGISIEAVEQNLEVDDADFFKIELDSVIWQPQNKPSIFDLDAVELARDVLAMKEGEKIVCGGDDDVIQFTRKPFSVSIDEFYWAKTETTEVFITGIVGEDEINLINAIKELQSHT